MDGTDWILLDTEATGFVAPVFVVEIAAQRMRGWGPLGAPFRRLLNQSRDIPPEASRVHGYTREVLERDGEPPEQVYLALAAYAGELPLVSYNLDYDLDQVLKPEWARLGLSSIGSRGFCALRLAQRLLDPVPAGNCKLQTLRQYYRLPEQGAHTALGDVMTVVDLLGKVLRPIAEERGLHTWDDIVRHASEEWHPTRLPFGKFKGQSFLDAKRNPELRKWLDWLAGSTNAKSASMGRWYLRELARRKEATAQPAVNAPKDTKVPSLSTVGIVTYTHPDLARFRALVAAARARLAELEVAYTTVRASVSALQARLFKELRPHYEKRDRLRLIVGCRKAMLDALLRHGEEEAARVQEEYRQAEARSRKEYEETDAAMQSKRRLSTDEEGELKSLWKKLVKLFHPDRYADDPDKLDTYTKLTAVINAAKDNGDLATLRQIADDPTAFILRQGWTTIEFGDTEELDQLRRLWESLEAEILAVLEATNTLKDSPEHELYQVIEATPDAFGRIVVKQIEGIEREVADLSAKAEELKREIAELGGMDTHDQPSA